MRVVAVGGSSLPRALSVVVHELLASGDYVSPCDSASYPKHLDLFPRTCFQNPAGGLLLAVLASSRARSLLGGPCHADSVARHIGAS